MFGKFLEALVDHVSRPLTLVLDNASIHKATELKPLVARLQKEKGLRLYFLPPYNPELNRIEKFWHKMKHELLEFKARDRETLENDVTEVLRQRGAVW